MAVLHHGYCVGLCSKESASCTQGGTGCSVYFCDNFGGFYPISPDDDICAGDFHVEPVWSWQMETEADKH